MRWLVAGSLPEFIGGTLGCRSLHPTTIPAGQQTGTSRAMRSELNRSKLVRRAELVLLRRSSSAIRPRRIKVSETPDPENRVIVLRSDCPAMLLLIWA